MDNLKKMYPAMTDILKSFEKKALLLTIKGPPGEDDYPLEFDDLMDAIVWELHYAYDDTLEETLPIEERFRLHRHLEKAMFDAGLTNGDDLWFNEEYNYPSEEQDTEEFWAKIHNDPNDPFYDVKIRTVSLEELGI
jgi:hypothetical protein